MILHIPGLVIPANHAPEPQHEENTRAKPKEVKNEKCTTGGSLTATFSPETSPGLEKGKACLPSIIYLVSMLIFRSVNMLFSSL